MQNPNQAWLSSIYDFLSGKWFALLWLATLEYLVFGRAFKSVNFYLDDWTMLAHLSFGPQSLLSKISTYFLSDPRVTLRPLEAPYFATLHQFFGQYALWYHIVSGLFEVLAIWVFWLLIVRLTQSKATAFIATTLTLLDPRHDTTHYWVMCNSVSFSLFCSVLSLYFADGASNLKNRWLAWILYVMSLLNYEVFIGWFPLNAWLQARKMPEGRERYLAFAKYLALYFAPIAAVIGYQKYVVPLLVEPFVHAAVIDPMLMSETLFKGFDIQLGLSVPAFFVKQIMLRPELLQIKQLILPVVAALATAGIAVWMMVRQPAVAVPNSILKSLKPALIFGLDLIICSYAVFGLNREYMPTIETVFNRVNTGAGLGASLIVAAIIVHICLWVKQKWQSNQSAVRLGLVACMLPVAGLVLLYWQTCIAFQDAWMVSAKVQRKVQTDLKAQGQTLPRDAGVILINCPRYVNWTPVFDGVWDFEKVLQLTLNRQDLKGTVASERLEFDRSAVQDVSMGFVCGKYPIANLYVLLPDESKIYKIDNAEQCIDLIATKGRTFGLQQQAVNKWRAQVAGGQSK
jgi:hypothetical protein